jgi:ParB family chromosome partitioning protein
MDTLHNPGAAGEHPDSAPDQAPISHLGRELKTRRASAGLSQRALAKASGVPQSTISNLESGGQATADRPTVAALAAALHCPPADLLGPELLETGNETGIILVPYNRVHRSDLNPRRVFDPEKLAELADSIDAEGILENLLVRADPAIPGDYLVVAGERRWRAVGLLVAEGRRPADTPLPVRVVEADEVRHRILAIVENLQREDVAPLDEARAFRALVGEEGWSTVRIGKAIGKTDRHVQLRLALLYRLHQDVQDALDEGRCTLAIARALTVAPMALQPELLKIMENVDGARGLRTAEDLAAYIRSDLRTGSQALFRLEDYAAEDGERFDDPDSGETYLLDVTLFVRLQHAAIDALESDLKARYAWVERQHNRFWEPCAATGVVVAADAKTRTEALEVGAVIRIDDKLAVTVFTELVKPAQARGADGPTDEASRDDQPHGEDGHEETPPQLGAHDPVAVVSPERRAYALKVKTSALQAALLRQPRAWQIQLALALMGSRDVADILVPPPMPTNAVVAAAVTEVLTRYRETLGSDALFLPLNADWPYLSLQSDSNFIGGGTLSAAVEVLDRLQALPDANLDELLAALTISRCATRFQPARANLGDNPLVLVVAASTGADPARDGGDGLPWQIDADYLATLSIQQMLRLARRVGVDTEGDGIRLLNPGHLSRVIRDHCAQLGSHHLPPEMRFALRVDLEEALFDEAAS